MAALTQFSLNKTGTSYSAPTLGNIVNINNVPVVITTGTAIANVVTDINALTEVHGVIASNSAGNLALVNSPLFATQIISVTDGTPGITALLGFLSPTVSAVAFPTSQNQGLAKKRGNIRWKILVNRLSQLAFIEKIYNVVVTGGSTFSANPTAISFKFVCYGSQFLGVDATNNNNTLYDINGVKNAVAQAMLDAKIVLADPYDPTVVSQGTVTAKAGTVLKKITVNALTNSSATALGAITVAII